MDVASGSIKTSAPPPVQTETLKCENAADLVLCFKLCRSVLTGENDDADAHVRLLLMLSFSFGVFIQIFCTV